MTGLVRKATLLSACGLLMAGAAMAGIPNAGTSTLPALVVISDGDNGVPCQSSSFVIRDAASNPVPLASVVLEFATCAGADLPLVCTAQANDLGVTISAINKTASKSADALGAVSFRLIGQGTHPTLPGGEPTCVRVYANSQLLGTIKWRLMKYDLDNTGIVGGPDGTLWVNRFLAGGAVADGWADYDCTGIPIGGPDGTLWVDAFLLPLAVCTGPTW